MKSLSEHPEVTNPQSSDMTPVRLLPIIRYAYYLFIFSVPIETLDVGLEAGMFSLSKLTGIMLIAAALLQPQVSFKQPPMPFWYFLVYIFSVS